VRRLVSLGLLLAGIAVVAVVAVRALSGGDDDAYRVRAEFRSAFGVIPGLDVKIAGVRVGQVESVDVTQQNTAAVTLRIDDPGYADFRADASCTIRPQTLIGERFVECTPTVPKAPGRQAAAPLPETDGVAQLPVTSTGRPVDIDLVNSTLRLPVRQRLSLILNELGTGLAGRGTDLDAAIRAANPALRETDRVLAVLKAQNRELEQLAVQGDRALAPLARDRARVASFVRTAGQTATATASQRTDLERTLELLPGALRQLRPTMQRLGAFSDQLTPLTASARRAAPGLDRALTALPGFNAAAVPAVRQLGDSSEVGRSALLGTRPILDDLAALGRQGRPLSRDLRELLTSLRDTGGIERIMDFFFFGAGAINGYDSFGHFLRAIVLVNLCSAYNAQSNDPACSANFVTPEPAAAASAATSRTPTAKAATAEATTGRATTAKATTTGTATAGSATDRTAADALDLLLGSGR
jgi:virulence factor Mce-like protein